MAKSKAEQDQQDVDLAPIWPDPPVESFEEIAPCPPLRALAAVLSLAPPRPAVDHRAAGLHRASILHLLRLGNAAARARAKAAGHRQHRTGHNPFQLGGSFVFGPGNVDRFAHLSRTFGDNADPTALLAALPL